MTSSQSSSLAVVLMKSLTAALRCIDQQSSISDDCAHEARKQLKRARAALRLLRPGLGDEIYRRENQALRDVSRVVSPLRDARAKLDILDTLRARHSRTLAAEELALLSMTLLKRLGQAHSRLQSGSRPVRKAIRMLRASQRRLRNLLRQEAPSRDLKKGMRKIYRRAQRTFEAAKAHPTPDSLHAWRRKTKYLDNAVGLLDVPKRSRLAMAQKRARCLGDWLGEEHDLVVLSEAIERDAGTTSPSVQRDLKAAIHNRFVKLCAKSLRLGAKTYARRPRKVVAGA